MDIHTSRSAIMYQSNVGFCSNEIFLKALNFQTNDKIVKPAPTVISVYLRLHLCLSHGRASIFPTCIAHGWHACASRAASARVSGRRGRGFAGSALCLYVCARACVCVCVLATTMRGNRKQETGNRRQETGDRRNKYTV